MGDRAWILLVAENEGMVLGRRPLALLVGLLGAALCAGANGQPARRSVQLSGKVTDQSGAPAVGARVSVGSQSALTDARGHYELSAESGLCRVEVSQQQRAVYALTLDLEQDKELDVALGAAESVTVRAGQEVLTPDPATEGYSRAELMEANPGRPGVPLSVPGYPVETASGGIKAPQYFAPGVAGDHGEPVAQFFNVNGFLFQNNLTANAHGNGYADPNFVIGSTVGGVLVDHAGYNARYGDHSIALAVTYDVRGRGPVLAGLTTDGRDGSVEASWSPRDDHIDSAVEVEAMWGNGFLRRPEERQQYKANAIRSWKAGRHEDGVWRGLLRLLAAAGADSDGCRGPGRYDRRPAGGPHAYIDRAGRG